MFCVRSTVEAMTEVSPTIEFALDHLDNGARRVTPVVGGVSLIDLVLTYETSKGLEPAGGYDGLILDHFNFGDPALYLSGNKAGVWPGPGRVALLGCSCGEVGCWPLFARVRQTDEHVVWDEIEQPHRPGRDYSDFEPFRFTLRAYWDALDALESQVNP